jgi:hypothetical protein
LIHGGSQTVVTAQHFKAGVNARRGELNSKLAAGITASVKIGGGSSKAPSLRTARELGGLIPPALHSSNFSARNAHRAESAPLATRLCKARGA